jgi:hypothetical protein
MLIVLWNWVWIVDPWLGSIVTSLGLKDPLNSIRILPILISFLFLALQRCKEVLFMNSLPKSCPLKILGAVIFVTLIYNSRLTPKGKQRHLRYSSKTPTFYQNDLTIRNTAYMTGGKPIADWLQFISIREYCKSFSRLLRHPWKKGRGATLFLYPRHQTKHILL